MEGKRNFQSLWFEDHAIALLLKSSIFNFPPLPNKLKNTVRHFLGVTLAIKGFQSPVKVS